MASYKMDHRALTRSTDLKKILYIVIHNKIQNLDNDLILLVTSQKRKEKKILFFWSTSMLSTPLGHVIIHFLKSLYQTHTKNVKKGK